MKWAQRAMWAASIVEKDGWYRLFFGANDVEAHGPGGRHILRVSLNRIERLDPEKFTRIHRTHIVNLYHVTAFRRAANGRMVAEMRDGTRLPVSRQRAAAFRARGA